MATNRAPKASKPAISSSASLTEGMRADAPPPRRARLGRASRAASADPKRLMSVRKVMGPTLSVRIRRSQETRWDGDNLRRVIPISSAFTRFSLADPAFGAGQQAFDVFPMGDEQCDRQHHGGPRQLGIGKSEGTHRSRGRSGKRSEGGIALGKRDQ